MAAVEIGSNELAFDRGLLYDVRVCGCVSVCLYLSIYLYLVDIGH